MFESFHAKLNITFSCSTITTQVIPTKKDDSQQNQESDYPVTTKRTKFLLQISPVCQVTATLLRLYLNFQSDLLDNAHLVRVQSPHRDIQGGEDGGYQECVHVVVQPSAHLHVFAVVGRSNTPSLFTFQD